MDFKQRLKIKKEYNKYFNEIMKGDFNPYKLKECFKMTPIEENVWSDIRFLGLKMFPQFPIDKYFADFADPINKIVIEADGEKYHTDKNKDLIRQNEIEKLGWTIYRIKGKETYKCLQEEQDCDDYKKVKCNCSLCQLKQIKKSLWNT